MQQYLELQKQVINKGTWQQNRTGIPTKMIPAAMLQFDLRDGFPLVTTRKMPFKSVVGELLGFIRGCTSAEEFRSLGCNFWNHNANENEAWLANPNRGGLDDLGKIYGYQWTHWDKSILGYLNQLNKLVYDIKQDPESRRLLVSAWRPDQFHEMALPPCHVLFKVLIDQSTKTMHLSWYQRSCDLFLGIPANIASYATLLTLLAKTTGYNPGILTGHLDDVHIYENHMQQVLLQLSREPLPLPKLVLEGVELGDDLASINPSQIYLEGYTHHDPIKAPMAV